MDLKQFRLDGWQWYEQYKAKYGLESFNTYKDKIISMLYDLKPGRTYDLTNVENSGSRIFIVSYNVNGVETCEQNPDLFVKICCMFMLSCSDYSFSDDYNKIIRK